MRQHTSGLTLAVITLLLAACSGGGGGSNGGGTNNTPPVANAGVDQTVTSGVTVTLNGTGSNDPDGSIATYAWTQSAGSAVTLASAATSQPTFAAPTVATAATLTFSLVVTDNRGATSSAASVSVTINPPVVGTTNVTGRVTFARVPFATAAQDPDRGLYYASPQQQPARGVVVRAIDANTQDVLASGETDSQGDYSLAAPTNTSITIRVVAQMLRGGAAPNWDVRVQDGTTGTPYSHTEPGSFNSSSGTAHNIAIPTGINSSGIATGTRASGPFAALDTIYQGIQTILSVSPASNFPALIVDWGSQTDGTFFASGSNQRIALLSNLSGDTDEFDQHVIAHEFGHYIEYNFSRADNIGGAHSIGEKIDARVAFGEGFGYAFAAMVLNDPIARDSSSDNGDFFSGSFNLETNPPANPAGAVNGNYGCWCSESSVWSILWDVFDSAVDTNDSIALGFQPIWNVLVNDQRVTPAFTTIFSFVTTLKAQNPGSVAAINTLVAAQNIDAATIDAYGTGETHVPTEVPGIAALPLYTVATIGGPSVVLRTVNDEGRYNKLGNHRYLRFNVPTSRTVTISASSSNPNNPDADFLVFRAGTFVRAGVDPPAQNPEVETFSASAGEYVIDVFDCANGCSDEEGTPGDYDLTVTIN